VIIIKEKENTQTSSINYPMICGLFSSLINRIGPSSPFASLAGNRYHLQIKKMMTQSLNELHGGKK